MMYLSENYVRLKTIAVYMKKKMKLIILDFDGTMGDSEPLITRTMLEDHRRTAFGTSHREQCAAMIGLPLKQTFTDLIPMSDEMGMNARKPIPEYSSRTMWKGCTAVPTCHRNHPRTTSPRFNNHHCQQSSSTFIGGICA